jgi:hypothetical protein
VQVVPRRSARRFGEDGATGARVLHDVLGRLRAVLRHVAPVNACQRLGARGAERRRTLVLAHRADARLAQLAGLDVGTGVHPNVPPPERAAEQLRKRLGQGHSR